MRFTHMVLIVVFLFASSASAALAKSLMPLVEKKIICKVWVTFKDKKSDGKSLISSKASLRRRNVNYHENETDLNVSENYIRGVESCGAKLHHIFKWENSASFILQSNNLEKIASLSYVKDVTPVGICTQHFEKKASNLQKKKTTIDQIFYGSSFDQLNLVNVPSAHNYLL
jgi:hypothetical protein